ncbi:LIC20162 family protein [Leptospira sp. SA-E8]|uniref:LIC20162 family protein n=1 Tax=Leptospira sp. SA-E8 TaxID=3422259 RepID=UPI003EBC755B
MNKSSKSQPVWWNWESSEPGIKPSKIKKSKLRINYVPPFFAILVYGAFIFYLFPFRTLVSTWIFKFVELLQITKVLKLSLLTDKRLYDYTALFVISYIAFAFFLDLVRFLRKNLFQVFVTEENRLAVTKWGLLGKETIRWNPDQTGLQIHHKSGWFRSLLGLEKLSFRIHLSETENSVLAESPYFFSKTNREFLSSVFRSV